MTNKKLLSIVPESKREYLTLKEASEQYNLPLATLRKWATQRRFPLLKLPNNKIRVLRADFEDFLDKHKRTPVMGR